MLRDLPKTTQPVCTRARVLIQVLLQSLPSFYNTISQNAYKSRILKENPVSIKLLHYDYERFMKM